MGVELPLCVVVTILECCVTFSGVKLSIKSFVLFESSKNMVISLIKDGIKSFNPACQTCMQPDWSKEGISYLLLQKHCQCAQKSPVCCKDHWKLMFTGSQFMNNAGRKLPILKIVLIAAHANAQYQDLLHIITIGFPKRHNETEPAHLWEFWEVHHRLSVFYGVALLDQHLVFPIH